MPINGYPHVVQILDQSAEAARWDIAAQVAKARFVAARHLVPQQGSDLSAGGFVSAAVRPGNDQP